MNKKVLVLALLATACATTQKKKKKDDVEPPNAGIMKQDIGGVKDDAAVRDFEATAAIINKDAQKGKLDWGDVEDKMGDLTHRYPNFALGHYNRAVALEHLGKHKEAEQEYRTAAGLNPQLREARENLAVMAAKSGDPGESISVLRELVTSDPGAAQARVALASYVASQGDFDEARQLCEDALAHQPKNIGAYCVLATVAVKEKDMLRARLLAAQGLKIEKNAACLHDVLGQVALAEGNTGVALKAFETAVQSDPRLTTARFRIAQISMGFKDFKKAIDNYIAITQADPKNAAAYVNLGIAFKGSGRFQDAEKAYQQAIQVADGPSSAPAHFNLGVLYLRDLKRPEEAQEHLKRVLQVGDGDDDQVFKMLEEIEQMKQLEEESKRQEAEAKAQEEIEKKAAEEEAKQKKLDDEINKKIEAEEKSRSKEEPGEPEEGGTPPIDDEPKKKAAPKASPKKHAPPASKKKTEDEPPDPDNFE